MRIYTFCIFLSLTFHMASAQEWAPIGAKWTYTRWYYGSAKIDKVTIRSVGDTVIQGKNCKVLKRSGYGDCDGKGPVEYMYSENDVVFVFDQTLDSFQMLYNFSASPGYEYTMHLGDWSDSIAFQVDSITNASINGISRRKIYQHGLLKCGGFYAGFIRL